MMTMLNYVERKQLTGEEFHEWNSHGDGWLNLWEFQQQRRQLPQHGYTHLIGTDGQSSDTCTRTLWYQSKLQCTYKFSLQINTNK